MILLVGGVPRIPDGLLAALEDHVVYLFRSVDDLTMLIAREQPAGVILMGSGSETEGINLSRSIPAIQLLGWSEREGRRLRRFLRTLPLVRRHYISPRVQTILHDSGYEASRTSSKLELPQVPIRRDRLAGELLRLGHQIAAGRGAWKQARLYLEITRRSWDQLRLETAYRTVHGSYKIVWLREQLCRWLSVLAHFAPGVDLACLPPPQESPPELFFIHWKAPRRSRYAGAAVLALLPDSCIAVEITKALEYHFEGEDKARLMETALRLMGLCALVSEVAHAQVWYLGELLNEHSRWHKGLPPSRRQRRREQLYCDFWGFSHLRVSQGRWRQEAVTTLRQTGDQIGVSHRYMSYQEFLRIEESSQQS